MKTAACYIRVSTGDQTEYSPDAQLKQIKQYAKNNNILLLKDYIFVEPGISGRKVDKRTEFKKMIATAKQKPTPFDIVFIHAFDRFARNVKESRIYKELLRQDLGIEVISITEDFGTGKNAFLMEGIKDVLNEYYSLNLGDEVLKGMTEKAERGEVQSIPPFGYTIENNIFKIIPEEAEIIKEIYNKFLNGDGWYSIAKWVNSMGVKTHRNGMFENRTIKYILQNPAYCGMIRWTPGGRLREENTTDRSIVVKGKHEPIIDMDT